MMCHQFHRKMVVGFIYVGVVWLGLCAEGKITLLSESHQASGFAGGWDETESFAFSGAGPVSGLATGTGYYGEPVFTVCTAGDWQVSASVSESIFSGAGVAESTYRFTGDCPEMQIHVAGATGMYSWDGNRVAYALTDLTGGQTVFSYASSTSMDYESIFVDESYRVVILPEHTYELHLLAAVSQGDAGATHSYLQADVTCVVPAPGAVLLSGIGSGMCVLWSLRKRPVFIGGFRGV